MLRRLDTHVVTILLVFAIVGAILAIVELLGVVLACCMASRFAKSEDEEWDYAYDGQPIGGGQPIGHSSSRQDGHVI